MEPPRGADGRRACGTGHGRAGPRPSSTRAARLALGLLLAAGYHEAATNAPPVAVAGEILYVEVEHAAHLDGSGSSDPEGARLMAKFGGVLNCTDADGDGAITLDECTLTDEELQLVLDTMGAHAFNFIVPDLASGDHEIVVQARLTTDTHVDTGTANARAFIGKGSVVVDEVHLVKDLDISL